MPVQSIEIDFKKVQNAVKKELKMFPALKVRIENKKEAELAGIKQVFPSFYDSDIKNELKFKQIQSAIDFALDDIEREIIKQKYLTSSNPTDLFIYLELGIKKEQYYEKKKSAIYSMAKALGIV